MTYRNMRGEGTNYFYTYGGHAAPTTGVPGGTVITATEQPPGKVRVQWPQDSSIPRQGDRKCFAAVNQ